MCLWEEAVRKYAADKVQAVAEMHEGFLIVLVRY